MTFILYLSSTGILIIVAIRYWLGHILIGAFSFLILEIRNQSLELVYELAEVDLALGQLLGKVGAHFDVLIVVCLVFLTFLED